MITFKNEGHLKKILMVLHYMVFIPFYPEWLKRFASLDYSDQYDYNGIGP